MPPNLQTVSLKVSYALWFPTYIFVTRHITLQLHDVLTFLPQFARRRSAKVMGSLAVRETEPNEGEDVQGILVTHNFHSKIVSPEDLATYTPLRVGSISSKLHVPYAGSIETLKLFLTEMFMGVTEMSNEGEGLTRFGLHENQVCFFICTVFPMEIAFPVEITWGFILSYPLITV